MCEVIHNKNLLGLFEIYYDRTRANKFEIMFEAILDKRIECLCKLGLTVVQAKIYVVLSETGRTKIQTIAKLAGTDRSNTYRVLDQLQKKGLVERIVGIPNLYQTVPMQDAARLLVTRSKHAYEEIVEASKELLKENKGAEGKMSEDNFAQISLINFKPSVPSTKVISAWMAVQRSGDQYFTKNNFEDSIPMEASPWIPRIWKRAMDRGVKIRIITEKKQEKDSYNNKNLIYLKKNSNFELKFMASPIICPFVCLDEKDTWFFIEKSKTFECIRLMQGRVGKLAHAFFEKLWNEIPPTDK